MVDVVVTAVDALTSLDFDATAAAGVAAGGLLKLARFTCKDRKEETLDILLSD